MSTPIRVGIVDDHDGVRVGIRNILAASKNITIVGEGINGQEALHLADQEKPDVLLLDVEMPLMKGDEVARRLHNSSLGVKVLAVSSYNDPSFVQGMIENGAAGYITKEEAPRLLVNAIHSIVQDGVMWISPNVAKKTTNIKLDSKLLSGWEIFVLRYIALGKKNEDIISILKIDPETYQHQLELLMQKLDSPTLTDLANTALHLLAI